MIGEGGIFQTYSTFNTRFLSRYQALVIYDYRGFEEKKVTFLLVHFHSRGICDLQRVLAFQSPQKTGKKIEKLRR